MSHTQPPSDSEPLIISLARLLIRKHTNDPILHCDASILRLLTTSLSALLPDASPLNNAKQTLDGFTTLLHLANQKINTLPFHAVSAQWLRLYTDASLGYVLASIHTHLTDPSGAAEWRKWIKMLDMAIIVAGAIGPRREEAVQALIEYVQGRFAEEEVALYARATQRGGSAASADDRISDSEFPNKRRRIIIPTSQIHYAPHPIPTPAHHPATTPTHPFIIRRYADHLSCPALHAWQNPAHLLSRAGPGRWVPVEVGRSYTDTEWGQRVLPFEVFLRRVGYDLEGLSGGSGGGDLPEDDRPLYLAQHDLLTQFPALRQDVGPLPDYIYAAPSHLDDKPYEPPGNEDALVMNVWVGSGAGAVGAREGTNGGPVVSPAHTDPYFNCYLQILGHKRVWLAPPHVAESMYAFPERDMDDGDADDSAGIVTSYTTNTSRVPIFANPDRSLGAAHEARYRQFYERAWPESFEAVLEPGDLLVMPPKWWHAMRSEGDGVAWSLSMWY